MSDFTAILTHGRKLQGAVKELSVVELELVAEKLAKIIQVRKEKEAEINKQQQEKQEKLADILKQLEDAGLGIADLQGDKVKSKAQKTGKKRPIKYTITDENNQTHQWTGIGRMPKVFVKAIESGKTLKDFSI